MQFPYTFTSCEAVSVAEGPGGTFPAGSGAAASKDAASSPRRRPAAIRDRARARDRSPASSFGVSDPFSAAGDRSGDRPEFESTLRSAPRALL